MKKGLRVQPLNDRQRLPRRQTTVLASFTLVMAPVR